MKCPECEMNELNKQAAFELAAKHIEKFKLMIRDTVGPWLSAALESEVVCEEMKEDIRKFFKAIE